ncbi:hypothetical protein EV359DRAFT_88180 [Lentinula novae-zelandiae]|nr:hypothetical protein EV359DRAFT_88180 [Lentinula novae-zelandiae]
MIPRPLFFRSRAILCKRACKPKTKRLCIVGTDVDIVSVFVVVVAVAVVDVLGVVDGVVDGDVDLQGVLTRSDSAGKDVDEQSHWEREIDEEGYKNIISEHATFGASGLTKWILTLVGERITE